MTLLRELLNRREKAGRQYGLAVSRFYLAYLELASVDRALANASVGHTGDVRTFSPLAADLRPFDHPVYCQLRTPCDWRDEISALTNELLRAMPCTVSKKD